jgi:hypothetical protein
MCSFFSQHIHIVFHQEENKQLYNKQNKGTKKNIIKQGAFQLLLKNLDRQIDEEDDEDGRLLCSLNYQKLMSGCKLAIILQHVELSA